MELSPERQAELLAKYHADTTTIQTQRAEIAKASQQQWENRKVFFDKQLPRKVKNTQAPHVCEKCAGTIPKGSNALIRSTLVGISGNWRLVSKYRHERCPQ